MLWPQPQRTAKTGVAKRPYQRGPRVTSVNFSCPISGSMALRRHSSSCSFASGQTAKLNRPFLKQSQMHASCSGRTLYSMSRFSLGRYTPSQFRPAVRSPAADDGPMPSPEASWVFRHICAVFASLLVFGFRAARSACHGPAQRSDSPAPRALAKPCRRAYIAAAANLYGADAVAGRRLTSG